MAYKKMEPTVKKKWVKALRSGDYKQGTGTLKCRSSFYSGSEQFCCLGVLCDILPKKVGQWNDHYLFVKGNKVLGQDILRGDLLEHVNMTPMTQGLLTRKNDSEGASFEEIADWVEKNL